MMGFSEKTIVMAEHFIPNQLRSLEKAAKKVPQNHLDIIVGIDQSKLDNLTAAVCDCACVITFNLNGRWLPLQLVHEVGHAIMWWDDLYGPEPRQLRKDFKKFYATTELLGLLSSYNYEEMFANCYNTFICISSNLEYYYPKIYAYMKKYLLKVG